jgi:indole-3-glycerol phosphate synthase
MTQTSGAGKGHDFLARIADDRRRRVAQMQAEKPMHELRATLPSTQPAGRLERALRRGGPDGPIRMLCEVKRASPSKGMLNENVDPVAMAQMYERGGAAAVSLVTEPDHFLGDPRWMNSVRPHVALPLLLKDFVIDSYQIVDAAARGADAVLLLAALLSEVETQRYLNEARLLGLDALVEVHDAEELHRSLRAGATIVGINNRSLHTFEVDLETSVRLLPEIPSHVTAVAESGLSRPEDLLRLRATRCDAVLMGEVFMTSADPAAKLATLAAAARGAA